MPTRRSSYVDDLHSRLKDATYAAEYLNAVLEDSHDGDETAFLLALRDVAESLQMSKVAENAGVNRENLYRMLSGRGNPRLSSLLGVVSALGLRLRIEPFASAEAHPDPVQTHTEWLGRCTHRQFSYDQSVIVHGHRAGVRSSTRAMPAAD